MTRGFRLDALLRVRRVQEEQARSVLAGRNARLRDSDALRTRALHELAAFGEPGTDLDTLRAVAAGRASIEARLGELRMLRAAQAAEAEEARAAHEAADRRVRALERLETAHLTAAAAEDLRAEQLRLDELGSARAARREGA
ncbi:flagellar export protein FliJ [Agromyces sp. G08B096]|uniref:Flagellar export protein FliJ n=1 Tax=Agromyces sp. G08B096 TaxID=3156399 RepID=A0AAU7W7U4_9MICO